MVVSPSPLPVGLLLLVACAAPYSLAEDASWVRTEVARKMDSGLRALREGDARSAAVDLCWAASRALNSHRSNLSCGRALVASRRADEALPYLELASELQPKDLGTWVALGDARLAAGRVDAARAAYFKALELRKDYSPAFDGLGRLAQARDDEEAALESFGKALEANPADARARLHRGELHLEAGRLDQAREDIEEAARLRPDDAEVQFGLARTLLFSGLPNQALAVARRAQKLRPADARIPALLARAMLELGAVGESEEFGARAMALDPDLADARWVLAEALGRSGKIEQALEVLEPPDPERLLAREREWLGEAKTRWQERLRSLQEYAARAEAGLLSSAEEVERAQALLDTGRPAEAAAAALRATELDPSASTLRRAAGVLFASGRPMEALGVLRALEQSGQASIQDRCNLAQALEVTGNPREAERNYLGLIAVEPVPPEVFAGLSRLALARGEFDDLRHWLEQYLAHDPPVGEAARAAAALARLREGTLQETRKNTPDTPEEEAP